MRKEVVIYINDNLSDFSYYDESDEEYINDFLREQFWKCVFWGRNFKESNVERSFI